MTGYVTSATGTVWQLPVLTAWEVQQTDGDPCAAFSVYFPVDDKAAQQLRKGDTFRAEADGETVFTGVVDEFRLTLDSGGLMARLSGRDLTARLLDNQCRAAEYQSAQLEDILSKYVRPYGITKIKADPLPAVPTFSVQTGDTCWQVLRGYCRHAANVWPRVLADGTLCLEKNPKGKHMALTMANAPTKVSLQVQRYGVISEQSVLDFTRKSIETVKNAEFDGQCKQVVSRSGKTLKAQWRTAAQRIEDSRRNQSVLEVTLAGGFVAAPWDLVSASFKQLGVTGNFLVAAATSRLDAQGLRTTLQLREES